MRYIILLIVFNLTISCNCQNKVNHDYLITNINVIDVSNGDINLLNVGIDSNRISEIYYNEVIPSKSTIIVDGESKYLIPGLWDMHAHYHWNYEWSAPLWVANGIVGLREMNGDIPTVEIIRELSNEECILSPEIYSSHSKLNGPFNYGTNILVEDSLTAFAMVKEQKAVGANFIKIYSHLNRESFFAIAKQANISEIEFAGHLPESVDAFEAVAAGQKSFEHNLGIIEATAFGSDSNYTYFKGLKGKVPNWRINMYDYLIENHSDQLLDSLISELANSDTWLCPTMVALKGISYQLEQYFLNDYRTMFLPQGMLEYLNDLSEKKDTVWIEALQRKYEFDKSLFKKMNDGGVKFLAGSDFFNIQVYPGFSLHDELKIFNEAGFSPLEALQTATLNPAIFLNKTTDYGNIEQGKIASVIILNSNPLNNIENTKDIDALFLKGKYVSNTDIDSLINNSNY